MESVAETPFDWEILLIFSRFSSYAPLPLTCTQGISSHKCVNPYALVCVTATVLSRFPLNNNNADDDDDDDAVDDDVASHSHVIVTFTHCCCCRWNDDGNINNSNNNGIIPYVYDVCVCVRACASVYVYVSQYETAKRV